MLRCLAARWLITLPLCAALYLALSIILKNSGSYSYAAPWQSIPDASALYYASEGPPEATSTSQPSATSTVCPIQFTDVPPGSAFYKYVRCLACRGIIAGYPDGTFRPNDPVTRGQLAKIISESAGFDEDPGEQVFEDVVPASPFFVWINRLGRRGVMSGYPCGNVDEECVPPLNRPYFRPGSNATRGQAAKIAANAGSLNDPPGLQVFEDVSQDSPYFDYVQRLNAQGVVSGYPCGAPNEPCLPPNNRPYFRPNIQVSRGQASKMTVGVFFVGCSSP